MNIELTPELKALQQEVREYMKTVMTPELLQEMKDDELKQGYEADDLIATYARMGADGWIGLSWSKELGGKEMSHLEQYIFTDEVVRSGFAYPFLTTEAVTPVIAANANAEVREEVVGGVKQGKVVIAIGYSGSSTARKCGRAWPTTPITCGSRRAPIRTPPRSTRA